MTQYWISRLFAVDLRRNAESVRFGGVFLERTKWIGFAAEIVDELRCLAERKRKSARRIFFSDGKCCRESKVLNGFPARNREFRIVLGWFVTFCNDAVSD